MQNKGFIRVISILLTLICLFYLSFSVVTSVYNSKAEDYAAGDDVKYQQFIDSISTEKVYLGYYTYQQCREMEIGLGLDLKGGMNVTLQISVADILKSLSNNNPNPQFNEALKAAQTGQGGNKDFLNAFYNEYSKQEGAPSLAAIFGTYQMKEKIRSTATDEEVLQVLRAELNGAIDNSYNVLRNRIDRFGVTNPNIQKLEKDGCIMVELPGIKEQERVKKLLQGSANLEFWETYKLGDLDSRISAVDQEYTQSLAKDTTSVDSVAPQSLFSMIHRDSLYKASPVIALVHKNDTSAVNTIFASSIARKHLPKDLVLRWSVSPLSNSNNFQLVALKAGKDGKAALDGSVITDARDDFDQMKGSVVNMTMNTAGSKAWAKITRDNIGNAIAIVLDDQVYSFPNVNNEITGGQSEITGNFTPEEAKDLANVLKSGKMPAPARIVQEDVVGPSLGEKAIHDGMISFIIAFALVLLYMIMYYGLIPGLIADAALLFNVFFMMGILASFKAVLTLPGIAGIVLTLGMAVDANVLIFERIREELSAGKNFRKALKDGYSNAFSAIFDGNVTTLLIGIILAYFGTGPIKGFASTLIIGIITSFFSGVFMSRLIFERFADRPVMESLKFTTNFTKNWFQNTNFNFVKLRKTGYIVMTCFVVIFVISFFTLGFKQGIDFTGGRNFVVRFENTADVEAMREKLSNVFTESTVSVITMGADNQIRVSTNYGIESVDENIDTQIEEMLFNGLKEWLPEGVTLDMFVQGFISTDEGYRVANLDEENITTYGIQSSQKVGPAVADDIKVSAFWSIILALIVMAIYIVIRFRHWSFSLGAVAALAYDSLFMIGIYSLCHSFMPFSLEIDQVFIAAILTIIGYSINDTVVIFDRLRENLGLYPKRDLADQVNISLNTTLSRTFSTSLSTLTVLLAILIFGGETIRGFVFALTVGVIEGVFSTLFVAVPMAYDIEKKAQAKRISNEKK